MLMSSLFGASYLLLILLAGFANCFTTLSRKDRLRFAETSRIVTSTFGRNHPKIMIMMMSSPSPADPYHKAGCQLYITYCADSQWALRSFWMAQELLTTLGGGDSNLEAITLTPSRSRNATFRISSNNDDDAATEVLLWDRKENGGFPEIKELKQLVRDHVAPSRFLGHSDTASRQATEAETTKKASDVPAAAAGITSSRDVQNNRAEEDLIPPPVVIKNAASPHLEIKYCTGCRWLMRAAYFGQELLITFDDEINSVSLIPSRAHDKGGIFLVKFDGEVIWDRSEQGRFPRSSELKQAIQDYLTASGNMPFDDMDEDEAAAARRAFGVY